jgi:hypothetical protein
MQNASRLGFDSKASRGHPDSALILLSGQRVILGERQTWKGSQIGLLNKLQHSFNDTLANARPLDSFFGFSLPSLVALRGLPSPGHLLGKNVVTNKSSAGRRIKVAEGWEGL